MLTAARCSSTIGPTPRPRRSKRGGAASPSSIRSSRSARTSPSPRTSCSGSSRRAGGGSTSGPPAAGRSGCWSTSPIRISRPTPGWARCRSRPSRWSRSAAPWPPTLRHASFELRRGEILGIAGLIGSGRTELVRALFGLEPQASGRIALHGRALAVQGASPAQRLGQGFGYLSEDRTREGLALPLAVADNLTATLMSASLPGCGGLDLGRLRAAARTWIEALRIRAAAPEQPVRALSGGNQQKVAIGRLLYQDAEVLLLDEPTRGIDIGSRVQLYETIARCAVAGKGVLLVSSYLPELFGLCDRLAVMSRGRLSPARPIDEWTPETVLATAIGEAGL